LSSARIARLIYAKGDALNAASGICDIGITSKSYIDCAEGRAGDSRTSAKGSIAMIDAANTGADSVANLAARSPAQARL